MLNFVSWLIIFLEKEEGKRYSKRQIINHLESLFDYQLRMGFMPYDGKHFGSCNGEKSVCKLCLYEKYLHNYRKYVEEYKFGFIPNT